MTVVVFHVLADVPAFSAKSRCIDKWIRSSDWLRIGLSFDLPARRTSMTPEDLHRYITERMSHVYQPVMLRELLMSDGEASVDQIAKALIAHRQCV